MSSLPEEKEQALDEEVVESVVDEVPPSVVVRRNVTWSLPMGAAASAVAIAYLWRASGTGTALDWLLCAVMSGIAAAHLIGLVDARTPLLIADDLGVRIRLGSQWRGLPWDAVQQVVVEPRKGPLRDGRLMVLPHSLGRQLDGLDRRAQRQAALNQKLYGAALAVPLGLVTRISATGEQEIADRVAALSEGRADVVTLIEPPAPTDQAGESVADRHPFAVGLGSIVSRVAKSRTRDVVEPEPDVPLAPAASFVPLRETRPSVRAEIMSGAVALDRAEHEAATGRHLPEERQLRREGSVDLIFEPVPESNVRPIARMGDPVAPLVIDDFETQPAYDPVIGPELVAARHRVGLSVDELADRTRIRPHVIESIEVDDFAPCGGDVYARGHIRTLARVLGKDPEPLLASFDNRYAQAPISARRVFEAELATGMTGSMRSTAGGPNWSLLVGFVLALVLVWGVVRLFAGEPNEMVENPPPIPGAKSWPPDVYDQPGKADVAVRKQHLELVAVNAATRVQVTDPEGNVLFDQQLVLGESKTLRVPTRVTVSADNGGALSLTWGTKKLGLLGEGDQPADKELSPSAE
ncbi:MAG TPA: RodZ domain-containing protein [Nocardioidaceae bacterium]|nr:RodZ domain-containing protein [Nocardioidaceae bacterium]